MACNQKLTNATLKIYLQAIGSFQKRRAKKNGLGKTQTGAVTFQGYVFCRQSPPSHIELTRLAAKIHKKVLKGIEKMGLNEDFQQCFDEEDLAEISSLSIANKSGFGERAGKGIRRLGAKNIEIDPEGRDPCPGVDCRK